MLFNNNNHQSEMSDNLYNPTVHLTQSELMEKFNLAFYEGQNLSKTDILATFEDAHDQPEIKDEYLIDYLMTNNNNNATIMEEETYFDFNDFVDIFDRNLMQESSSLISTETETETVSDKSGSSCSINSDNYNQEFGSNQINHLDLDDIDLCDALSQSSLDLDHFTNDIQDLDELAINNEEVLPPITTITRNNIDFNSFIRSVPDNNLFFAQNDHNTSLKSEFGHLIGQKNTNNNFPEDPSHFCSFNHNQVVLHQNEALLQSEDDPLLSSSSLMYPYTTFSRRKQSESDESTSSCEDDISSLSVSSYSLICQWENCYQVYESQSTLVKHIEKCHVEVKRGDEFTCFWSNCPRKIKPFNARYKLLIHMRVHSGEKPNKCPFEGCNKAFSRLENLKIHQRSHTGERPYLCQFPTCTKSFSNSSDRAKHQRTHFDTKPYACQVVGCSKKYTDPSSLRKHVKNHTSEEQMLIKKKPPTSCSSSAAAAALASAAASLHSREVIDCANNKKFLDLNNHKQNKTSTTTLKNNNSFYTNYEHNYSNSINHEQHKNLMNIKQDLKNKISEKNKLKNSNKLDLIL